MSIFEVLIMETRVTASQFQQAFGLLSDKARREPVIITKHGKPSLVVMAVEEWERLKGIDSRADHVGERSQERVDAVARAETPAEHASHVTGLK
jgi:prevent-host-death family protein